MTKEKLSSERIAETAVERHLEVCTLAHYAGIVTLHGLVNLAANTGRADLRKKSCALLKPFYSGEVKQVGGVYDKMYQCGGTASALLVKYGYAPEALDALTKKADELIKTHPRDPQGIFGKTEQPEKIWIDTVFAVCPFLAILGNLTGRGDFIEEAVRQMVETDKLLMNRETGLYHQSLNFAGPGKLSEDHWSRGNGWGALALAELIVELPENEAIRTIYTELMAACVKFQDENGVWHQEMTRPDSYVETSGGGLILYAIGRGLELGVLPESFREPFVRGLKGYLSYIALDGSVFHTCRGCLCPGKGRIEDYMAREWIMNDIHSFGPVALAFGQALNLGITEI